MLTTFDDIDLPKMSRIQPVKSAQNGQHPIDLSACGAPWLAKAAGSIFAAIPNIAIKRRFFSCADKKMNLFLIRVIEIKIMPALIENKSNQLN